MWQDVRFALRVFIKARGMTTVALITLAIGIGANAAIFSVVNAVLLRPLPFHDPGQLVQLRADLPGVGAQSVGFSEPEFADLRDRAGIFESVSVVFPGPANLTGGERPERIQMLGVSPNYFDILGATPQIGRLFDNRDVAEGFAEAVVISDGLWRRDFAADASVLGRKVRIDNDLYTIVGVLPPEFRHPAPATAKPIDLWGTAGFRASPFPGPIRSARLLPGVIARLRPGIGIDQARARLATLADSVRRDYGPDYPANGAWTIQLTPLKEEVIGNSQTLLLTLLLAVALILLIACVNVASLLLARSSARQREIAVRIALGATRARIVRQLLTESAVLSVAAGFISMVMAVVLKNALVRFLPQQLPRSESVVVDARVLLFTFAVAVLTSLIFGLAPALQTSRQDAQALKQDGRTGEASVRSGRTRSWLVGTEIAFSLMLVVGAGLLLRTFWELLHVHPGFVSENILSANIWLPVPNDLSTDVYGTTDQRAALNRELIRRMHTISGVKDAAIASSLPLRNQLLPRGFRAEGQNQQGDPATAFWVFVSPDFFRTMGGSLERGRMLAESDSSGVPISAVIDDAAARLFWGKEDPIGRRIRLANNFFNNGMTQQAPWMTVVGVVSNMKFGNLDEGELPHIYPSAYQLNSKFISVVVRATGDPAALGRDIQSEIQSVDPNLPVSDVASMTEVVTASVEERRFAAWLIGLFAVLSLGLAAIGVYGVAAYGVQQRMREFGIRTALGATKANLVGMVLRDCMAPVLGGLVAGLIGAALAGRAISTLLYGVKTIDLSIYLLSAAVLVLVGAAANYIPARRAGKVDPNLALRYE